MKKALLTSVAALTFGGTLGGALAQNSFPDVPPDSYAADAVAQLAELGIVNGFPDGTFRGNDAFTRYQAALVVSRLLDVIEENTAAAGALSEEDLATVNNAVAELSNELTALGDRVTALENAPAQPAPDLGAIEERLAALEAAPTPPQGFTDTLTALQDRVAALEEAPAAPGADVTALQEQITALNQQVNELQAQLEAVTATAQPEAEAEEPTPEEPPVDLAEAVTAPAAVAVSGERGKFYLGVGGFYEVNYDNPAEGGEGALSFLDNIRVRPRVKIGIDDIVSGFGVRLAADYGRQAVIEAGSITASGHLTYSFGVPAAGAYLGVGGGYQFNDLLFSSNVEESPFAGALLGAEFGSGPTTFFVEGTADYYFNDIGIGDDGYQQLYPTVAVGFNLRP